MEEVLRVAGYRVSGLSRKRAYEKHVVIGIECDL